MLFQWILIQHKIYIGTYFLLKVQIPVLRHGLPKQTAIKSRNCLFLISHMTYIHQKILMVLLEFLWERTGWLQALLILPVGGSGNNSLSLMSATVISTENNLSERLLKPEAFFFFQAGCHEWFMSPRSVFRSVINLHIINSCNWITVSKYIFNKSEPLNWWMAVGAVLETNSDLFLFIILFKY